LFASTGFITLIPDYVGYNTSSQTQHPYFINKLSDRTLRDMITTSTEALNILNILNVSHDSKLFLNGFSEGANITVSFLKDLEQNPIPGLTITAISTASGA
jgi:predicted esterase